MELVVENQAFLWYSFVKYYFKWAFLKAEWL